MASSGGIEEVRARADILEIVGAHVRLRRAGRNYVGLCPFHEEKTPSFSVNAERGFFHCFGCGVGGTVFDFVMKTEGLNFAEALHSLAKRYGVNLPEARGGVPSAERDALTAANQTAAEFFAHVLWNTAEGAPARSYLQNRKITDETAKAFMVGFAPARPANLAAVLTKRGLIEGALKTGLIKREPGGGMRDMFRARLMFPIRDVQGRVIAFGGRVLDTRLPKYINSTESQLYSKARTVYGLYEGRPTIAKADRAIVVEGYIDAIALAQAGFKETVASLGTALTVEQLRLLGRYTKNIFACFDGDNAGRKASLRALEVFLNARMTGRGVFIPSGFDPDTLVRERGAEAFAELLDSAELLVDFLIKEQAAAAADDNARARAADRVAAILAMVMDPFEYDLLARKAATLLGVNEELLRRESRKRDSSSARPYNRSSAEQSTPPVPSRPFRPEATVQATIGLIAIALYFPALRPEVFSAAALHLSEDPIWPLMQEICFSEEPPELLEATLTPRLDDAHREFLSAYSVRLLPSDDEAARAEAIDYVGTIEQARRQQGFEALSRIPTITKENDVESLQKAIDLKVGKSHPEPH
ncbi:MAG TPA: DNA primase [Candidatus Binataceae bacterium]|nr:DNA primase [Candidatus Binataceae bacterium]